MSQKAEGSKVGVSTTRAETGPTILTRLAEDWRHYKTSTINFTWNTIAKKSGNTSMYCRAASSVQPASNCKMPRNACSLVTCRLSASECTLCLRATELHTHSLQSCPRCALYSLHRIALSNARKGATSSTRNSDLSLQTCTALME